MAKLREGFRAAYRRADLRDFVVYERDCISPINRSYASILYPCPSWLSASLIDSLHKNSEKDGQATCHTRVASNIQAGLADG